MRVVLQRSKAARVVVAGETIGEIESGLVLLVGVTHDDTAEDAAYLAEKIVNLRIFEDENGKMNHSLLDVGGSILSVSQFTLYGDCRKAAVQTLWMRLVQRKQTFYMNNLMTNFVNEAFIPKQVNSVQ